MGFRFKANPQRKNSDVTRMIAKLFLFDDDMAYSLFIILMAFNPA
jgi:hypothetical protein